MVNADFGDGDKRNWIQTTTNDLNLDKTYIQTGVYTVNFNVSNFTIPMSSNMTLTGS